MVKIYDEVVDKFGDLTLDLGKTAVIAGLAGFFVERIDPTISIGTIIVGFALIYGGFYSFYFKNRRQEKRRKEKR